MLFSFCLGFILFSFEVHAGFDEDCQRAGGAVVTGHCVCPDQSRIDPAVGQVCSSLRRDDVENLQLLLRRVEETVSSGLLGGKGHGGGGASSGPACGVADQAGVGLLTSSSRVLQTPFDQIPRTLTCVTRGGTYTFPVRLNVDNSHFAILRIAGKSADELCLKVQLSKGNQSQQFVAYLDQVAADPACLGLRNNEKPAGIAGIGRCFVEFAVAASRGIGASYIHLFDASAYDCPRGGSQVPLAMAKLVISGRTWYEGFGFVPGKEPGTGDDRRELLEVTRDYLRTLPPDKYKKYFPTVRFEDFSSPQEALQELWQRDCSALARGIQEFWGHEISGTQWHGKMLGDLPAYWHMPL